MALIRPSAGLAGNRRCGRRAVRGAVAGGAAAVKAKSACDLTKAPMSDPPA